MSAGLTDNNPIFVQVKAHHSQDSETSGLGEEIESSAI